jgi:hypothetical protein
MNRTYPISDVGQALDDGGDMDRQARARLFLKTGLQEALLVLVASATAAVTADDSCPSGLTRAFGDATESETPGSLLGFLSWIVATGAARRRPMLSELLSVEAGSDGRIPTSLRAARDYSPSSAAPCSHLLRHPPAGPSIHFEPSHSEYRVRPSVGVPHCWKECP